MLFVLGSCVLLFVCFVCFLFLGNRTKFGSTISNQQRKFKNLPDFEVIARKKDGMQILLSTKVEL